MSNGKYNSNWKNELDELSGLPGESSADINLAWNKLEGRLTKKKATRKPFWYWVAAACFFSCILGALIISNNKHDDNSTAVVETIDPVKTKTTEKIPATISSNETPNVSASTVTMKHIKQPVPVSKKKVTKTLSKDLMVITSAVENSPENKDSLSATVSNIQPLASRPVTFPALKKKMPVVHVNDLEKPVSTGEAVAGNNNDRSFRVRLLNRQAASLPTYSNPESGNVLRIKLPPQN